MFVLICCLVLPFLAAILVRYGLINSYAGALIAYVITRDLTCASAVYLTVIIGSVLTEYQGYSGEIDTLIVCDFGVIYKREMSRRDCISCILRRTGSIVAAALIVGAIFGKIPLPAIPWPIYVLVFGALLLQRSNSQIKDSSQHIPGTALIAVVACSFLVVKVLDHYQFPLNTALICVAALSSLLSPYFMYLPSREVPEDSGFWLSNWVDILVVTAVVWNVPGLTPSTGYRCLSSQPSWIPGLGSVDALLEGWTLGAWIMHGNLSSKTMLGSSLKSWIYNNDVLYPDGHVPAFGAALIVISALLLAVSANILAILLIGPLSLDNDSRVNLPLILAIPLVTTIVINIPHVVPLISVLLLAVVVMIFAPKPGLRSIPVLLVTAG